MSPNENFLGVSAAWTTQRYVDVEQVSKGPDSCRSVGL